VRASEGDYFRITGSQPPRHGDAVGGASNVGGMVVGGTVGSGVDVGVAVAVAVGAGGATMVVVSEALCGGSSAELTVTVLVIGPRTVVSVRTHRLSWRVAPGARSPRLQVIEPSSFCLAPAGTEMGYTPAGSVSVTRTR